MAEEVMVDITVDQAMLDANPTLVAEGTKVGDVIKRPETAEETAERVAAEAKVAEEGTHAAADEADAAAAAADAAEKTAAAGESAAADAEASAHGDADAAAENGARHPLA